MHEFLNRLTTSQLLKLINRYGLKAQYKNPQKRRMALIRELRAFWSKNPVEDCAICLDENSFDHMVITPCAHLFCDTCLIPYIRTKENCPMCRTHCSYIEVIGQLSKDRFIKVRNIIHPIRNTHITTHVPVEPMHPIQLILGIPFTICVLFINVFVLYLMCNIGITYALHENLLEIY
jgi:hypothetical protein